VGLQPGNRLVSLFWCPEFEVSRRFLKFYAFLNYCIYNILLYLQCTVVTIFAWVLKSVDMKSFICTPCCKCGCENLAALILNLGTGWWIASLALESINLRGKCAQCPLGRRPNVFQTRSEPFEEESNLWLALGLDPRFVGYEARSSIPNGLSCSAF